ncbi:GNAT family N-acetyltransferase [Solemya elarraichensis gill symbiont]|uniref:GNAT family N-acetyltransferase n=1 Tax=Solemya elarraichensis gill symbiont TaxID=1918949 RepID=UPI001FE8EF88|nr:GNAT family N-acetyltransferase [Solemya elarraichensis gill symbiont]
MDKSEMEFVCYADWNQLPESANALFAEGSKESVFFSRPWFENLVNTALENGQSMLLACVVKGEDVLAILPLMKRDSEQWTILTHLYSSLYSLLLAEKNRQKILECMVQGLTELPVYPLRLDPVAENDENIRSLQRVIEASGAECHHKMRFYNWIHRVNGQSFEEYLGARPARVRNTVARKKRKLEREHGYEIRLFINQDLEQAIADFNAVYKASWKAKELFGGFVKGLAYSLSEPGWLRLAILYIDGQPAAAQFWFVVHGKASIFKLAYDEVWKQYSPGSILISYLMEYVIETDKVEEIDFLTGNDAYKQDWMSERRERFSLYCGKPRISNSKSGWFDSSLKNWVKRFKGSLASS